MRTLLDCAKDAADKLFAGKSVTREETRSRLEDLIEHVECMLDTLEDAGDAGDAPEDLDGG